MKPLAAILRPTNLEDLVGQEKLIGLNGPLRMIWESRQLPSLVLWGPPGCGKTTVARMLAERCELEFTELSGTKFSVADLAKIPKDSKQLVFVDEIHRLSKSQQAYFLPNIEEGIWTLVSATTENPSFEIISPILSRSQVLVFEALDEKAADALIEKAKNYYLEQGFDLKFSPEVKQHICRITNGDGRLVLNTVQALVELGKVDLTDIKQVQQQINRLHIVYDQHGEEHFNLISALHKSMRGSDASASLYYLARMLVGGEDPLYIARRLVRFAAEDIGNADRGALVVANAGFEATAKIGMPECKVVLAQVVLYLAQAKKSNLAYTAYAKAEADVQKYGNLPVPLKLRNAPTKFMKEQGYGHDYRYAHDYSAEQMAGEQYLPDKIKSRNYLD